jgi:L-fuconolactonase
MRIVDSQVHIWGPDTPERPWPARHAAQRATPLGQEELLTMMDAAGVDAAMIIPPSWEGERNDLVLAACQAHPARFAALGRIDPDASGARKLVASWREQPGMLGLRFSLHRPGMAEAIGDGAMDWLWGEAERHGVGLMVLLPHARLHYLDSVARRYPALRLIVDHLGVASSMRPEDRFTNLDKLLVLAKHPNVAVKASALPCFALDAYPYRSLHPHLRRVYDAFGPKRIFWGSDLSRLPCTYRQAVTMFTEEIPWLTDDDKTWIMGRSITEWLDWKVAAM